MAGVIVIRGIVLAGVLIWTFTEYAEATPSSVRTLAIPATAVDGAEAQPVTMPTIWTADDTAGAHQFALRAREHLQMTMRDYSSLLIVGPACGGYRIWNGQKQFFLLGHMNAKNAYGGYGGPQAFEIVDKPWGIEMELENGSPPLASMKGDGQPALIDIDDDLSPILLNKAS